MSIHIQFTNGSNPYVRYNMTLNEFTEELEKWQKNYTLNFKGNNGLIYLYTATEKNNIIDLFDIGEEHA